MKPTIRLILLIFICFIMHIPNAFSQDDCDTCPLNIEDVKKDSRFGKNSDTAYSSENYSSEKLSCSYYENGRLQAEAPIIYKNGNPLPHGLAKMYDESGKLLAEIPYEDDNREGISKFYYENGKLKAEVPYKEDKVEGIVKVYNEDGSLAEEISYKNGLKE